jgi:uncharacterized repeat protein (TIGR01451 family)
MSKARYRGIVVGIITITVFHSHKIANATAPSQKVIELNNPYWNVTPIDTAGYSDKFYWGRSPRHPYGEHEMLSGEWGAAIYYDGIPTEPVDANYPDGPKKAMWLTDLFIYPTWETNSKFYVWIWPDPPSWDNLANPVEGLDTGRSVIRTGPVEVAIDYEMVDLSPQGPNGEGGSPLALNIGNVACYVNSDRYVLLQTYTITNVDVNDMSDITNLEFYQMLHGHPTGTYNAVVHSTYQTKSFSDPLESYAPYSAAHTVGNFRYDITQWNDGDPQTEHVDWEGFSCTVAPDVFENGYYAGHGDEKPGTGTHISIENRYLNGCLASYGQVAGAMGWHLGTLAYGESTSITVAVMFGAGPVMGDYLQFSKTDDVADCAAPGESISYTISYGNYDPSEPDVTSVQIVDYLPTEVDFDPATPSGNYDDEEHTVTWNISQIQPGTGGSIQVYVTVNRKVIPGQTITNRSRISYNIGQARCSQFAEVDTQVCDCSECGRTIYVDRSATGSNTGTSWQDAYTNLQTALAAAYPCDQIWVADGTYTPSDPNTFEVGNAVAVYGGFAGSESHRYERNWLENQTILSGEGTNNVWYVVTLRDGTGALPSAVDGFKIAGGVKAGVRCSEGSPLVQHNRITNNGYGVLVQDNVSPAIRNNWIYGNAEGIRLDGAGSDTVIRNNTIVYNSGVGIRRISSPEPQPIITNCIFWGHLDANNLVGCSARFSCLEDPNNLGCRSGSSGNIIGCNPQFHDVGAFDYHLAYNSPCKDVGDPDNTYGPYFGESDIDHQQRRADGNDDGIVVVDMGADEYCSNESSPADLYTEGTSLGRVRFEDYAVLADAWLTEPGENDPRDLNGDGQIYLQDLWVFAGSWLWQACWTTPLASEIDMMRQAGGESMMAGMGAAGEVIAEGGLAEETSAVFTEQESIDVDIDAIVDWLEGLWQQDEEIRSTTSEADWQAFVDSVKSAE